MKEGTKVSLSVLLAAILIGGGLIFSREKLKLALEALMEQGEGLLTQGT